METDMKKILTLVLSMLLARPWSPPSKPLLSLTSEPEWEIYAAQTGEEPNLNGMGSQLVESCSGRTNILQRAVQNLAAPVLMSCSERCGSGWDIGCFSK